MLFEHLLLLSADMSTRREMTSPTPWQLGNANANGGREMDAEGMAAFHKAAGGGRGAGERDGEDGGSAERECSGGRIRIGEGSSRQFLREAE
jgi:hypothetical protein